ncbi:hypothetical protein SISSUDRAFT_363734 [Sistotremastrum suecicum HHB10207 ss-3]|uniref:Secreted protein n=1 Tax=Sistotremastrum suecicum HHB10207 ss-3 TaxID=1314776 RepID=A0A165Z592_9AGAM|nr:hypothetical protein SISSUDRAFT_363734 [Sistotremastrum suecicum HHB10207 ss-3]
MILVLTLLVKGLQLRCHSEAKDESECVEVVRSLSSDLSSEIGEVCHGFTGRTKDDRCEILLVISGCYVLNIGGQ